jgi:mono/diheme cytochrome c family protein
MTPRQVRWGAIASFVVASVFLVTFLVVWLNIRADPAPEPGIGADPKTIPRIVERGAYLAKVGNCSGCHTPRGGPAYAGGVAIATPFGTVFTSNLTSDHQHGIGSWSSTDFWRAMHNGRSKDGHLLYPAFPYPSFSRISRGDSDAIYAYLLTLPPIAQANKAHALRFPYDRQVALAVWRALYFRPSPFEPQAGQTDEWNRGAYLVRGLGHCVACHSTRNALGATSGKLELAGGLIPVQHWYAPSLASPHEASVADWSVEEITELLATGQSSRGSVLGPMADVVYQSTQHFDDADLRAVAVFLKSLPQTSSPRLPIQRPEPSVMVRGEGIYKDRCATCHGETGKGFPPSYPALAGSRTVTMNPTTNIVRVAIQGGFPPTTAGNPRPFGMPPFGQALDSAEIAAVLTFIRNSWGNEAGPVSELDVVLAR